MRNKKILFCFLGMFTTFHVADCLPKSSLTETVTGLSSGVQGRSIFRLSEKQWLRRAPLPRNYTDYLGRKIFLFLITAQGIGSFALITLGVIFRKLNVASNVVHPMIRREISRCGTRLFPMFMFVAMVLGFLAI